MGVFVSAAVIAGSTVVMRQRFDAAEVLELIDRHAVTNLHLVPTQFHRLLNLDDATRSRFSGRSLKVVWRGAVPTARQTTHDRLVGRRHSRILRFH
jgi:long-chain acyl-CoA synthetase